MTSSLDLIFFITLCVTVAIIGEVMLILLRKKPK